MLGMLNGSMNRSHEVSPTSRHPASDMHAWCPDCRCADQRSRSNPDISLSELEGLQEDDRGDENDGACELEEGRAAAAGPPAAVEEDATAEGASSPTFSAAESGEESPTAESPESPKSNPAGKQLLAVVTGDSSAAGSAVRASPDAGGSLPSDSCAGVAGRRRRHRWARLARRRRKMALRSRRWHRRRPPRAARPAGARCAGRTPRIPPPSGADPPHALRLCSTGASRLWMSGS